jgi:hypothetical protein
MSIEIQPQDPKPQPAVPNGTQARYFDVVSATSKESMQHSLVGRAGHIALLGQMKEFSQETVIKSID